MSTVQGGNGRQRKGSIAVTERAVIQRINRKLAEKEEKVIKLRGRQAEELGEYVQIPFPNAADVAGWGRNGPVHSRAQPVKLEQYARELGVLQPYESLVE